MDIKSISNTQNRIHSDFILDLPMEPDFMGFGPVAGGKRCMLSGMALTASRLVPQPNLAENPSTLEDMATLIESDGWGIPATAAHRLEPRRFNYTKNTNKNQAVKENYLETINYAPEYNLEISEYIIKDTDYEKIDNLLLQYLVYTIKNCENVLVIFDSMRFCCNETLFADEDKIKSMFEKIRHKNIIPVFTKSDVFLNTTEDYKFIPESQFKFDNKANLREFQNFIHQQYMSKYDIYTELLEMSDHDMGYPIFFKTKESMKERVPSFPIETFGFKPLLDLLVSGNESLQNQTEVTQTFLGTVTAVREQRESLATTLQTAERSFNEAITRFAVDSQTVARIRFRQARDAFKQAQQVIDSSDKEVLFNPIEVKFEEQITLSSTALEDLALLEDSIVEVLSEDDIETVTDLEANTGEIKPTVVTKLAERGVISDEKSGLLTVLSWWYEGNSRKFTSEASISRRYEQADYGFKQSI